MKNVQRCNFCKLIFCESLHVCFCPKSRKNTQYSNNKTKSPKCPIGEVLIKIATTAKVVLKSKLMDKLQ